MAELPTVRMTEPWNQAAWAQLAEGGQTRLEPLGAVCPSVFPGSQQ